MGDQSSSFEAFSAAQVRRSAIWATTITIPLCLWGYSASMGLAHSGGPLLILFAPILVVLALFGSGGPFENLPEPLFLGISFLAQLLGTFVVVHAIRFAASVGSRHAG